MSRFTKLATTAALVATAGIAAIPAGAQTPGCTVRNNIEAIIDDSGSMGGTDFDKLRVQGMGLFIDSNPNKTLGAVEFGSDAQSIFTPRTIAGNEAFMKGELARMIDSDNGGTDYNAAFDKANSDNPGADARIFLTDGGHNGDDYANGHGNRPPTYVIGLGDESLADEDRARLQKIADDTGGRYLQGTTSANLQARFNEVSAELNCQKPPATVAQTFTAQGQQKPVTVNLGSGSAVGPASTAHSSARTKSVVIVTSWTSPSNRFDIKALRAKRGRKVLAKAARVTTLKVKRTRGTTYLRARVSRIPRRAKKLTFKVRAGQFTASGDVSANQAITQVTVNK